MNLSARSATLSESFMDMISAIGGFETRPTLAIAVSGGADSMALLLLAHDWASSHGGSVVALTVDHGLRPEAASEAATVSAWCARLGIAHQTLTLQLDASSGIQEQARGARYRVLTDYCREHRILHLLTAHHQGDQAETLLFRLSRGSGLSGLAGMEPVRNLHGVRLIRPLLDVSKEQLIVLLNERGQSWIEDPSNRKPIYTRNVLRQHLSSKAELQASDLASRLGNIRNLLEHKLASCLTECVSIFPGGYATLKHEAFFALPADHALAVLSALSMSISGNAYAPRSEKLELLYRELSTIPAGSKRSFFGCLFQRRRNDWLVVRETPQEAIHLFPGQTVLWDQRFMVSYEGKIDGVKLQALGQKGVKILPEMPAFLPKSALLKLPSFWNLEALLAVPHISYTHPAYRQHSFKAVFRPAKALAGTAFSGKNSLSAKR